MTYWAMIPTNKKEKRLNHSKGIKVLFKHQISFYGIIKIIDIYK